MAESAPENIPTTENNPWPNIGALQYLTVMNELTDQVKLLLKSDSTSGLTPDFAFELLNKILLISVRGNFRNFKLTLTLKTYIEFQNMTVAYLKLNGNDPQKKSMFDEVSDKFYQFINLTNPWNHPKEFTIPKDEWNLIQNTHENLMKLNNQYEEQHTQDITKISNLEHELEESKYLIEELKASKTLQKAQISEKEKRPSENIKTDLDEIVNLKTELKSAKHFIEALKLCNDFYEKRLAEKIGDNAIEDNEIATLLRELKNMVTQLFESNESLQVELNKYKVDYKKMENDLSESQKKVALLEKQQPGQQQQNCVLGKPYQDLLNNFQRICEFCNKPRNRKAAKIVGGTYQACVTYLKNQKRDLIELNELRSEIMDMLNNFGINEDPQLEDPNYESSGSSDCEVIE